MKVDWVSFLILDAAAIPGGGPDDVTHCVLVACSLRIISLLQDGFETMQALQCPPTLQGCTLSYVMLKLAQDCIVAKSVLKALCTMLQVDAATKVSHDCTLTGACTPPNPI